MKIILLLLCAVTLLASTGCVSLSGVDHTEYPGDLDHGEGR